MPISNIYCVENGNGSAEIGFVHDGLFTGCDYISEILLCVHGYYPFTSNAETNTYVHTYTQRTCTNNSRE